MTPFRIDELNEKTGTTLQITDSDRQIKLTKRESQILYFLSLSKSPKDIATSLSSLESKIVSHATIQSIITKKLYVKFNVYSISRLVEKANLLNLIPFTLEDIESLPNTNKVINNLTYP